MKNDKKDKLTKKLRKKWREDGYHKFMPFGNFRKLYMRRKTLSKP